MKRFALVVVSSRSWLKYGIVSVLQKSRATTRGSELDFYLLVERQDQELANRLLQGCNERRKVHVGTLTSESFSLLPSSPLFTPLSWARLFLPQMELFEGYEKLALFGVDTWADGDVRDLFDVDFEESVAAVLEPVNSPAYGRHGPLGELELQFNADVIVYNLPAWKHRSTTSNLNRFLQTAPLASFEFYDQDVMNLVLQGNWHQLPLTWNYIPALSSWREARSVESSQKLTHWAGYFKPWNGFWVPPYQTTRKWREFYFETFGSTEDLNGSDSRSLGVWARKNKIRAFLQYYAPVAINRLRNYRHLAKPRQLTRKIKDHANRGLNRRR